MGKALEGVRVIDFTHDQAGPACTQMLAWLGADVIKIERPPLGDRARKLWYSDRADIDSYFFLLLNSNKRSVVLNLKAEEGKEIAQRLVATADVVTENFGPGVMERLGLGYEAVKAVNPSALYASVKGFGPFGTYPGCHCFEMVARATGAGMSAYAACVPCAGTGPNDYVYLMRPPDNAEPFGAMVEVIEREDLRTDPRFSAPPARARHAEELTAVIESWTMKRDKHEVMRALAGRGIPCGAVLDTAEVLDDPHLRERGTVFDLDHPTRGRFAMIGSPLRMSDSPTEASPAPLYGEHTEEVLTTLAGYTPEDVRRFREQGIV